MLLVNYISVQETIGTSSTYIVARVDVLFANSSMLRCDAETARQFGEVKNQLRLKGRVT